jgi:hypothetical protein
MRRVMIAVTAVLAVAAMAGCKKSNKPVQYVEDGASQLSSAVNTGDPRAAIQLLRGFHDIENNAWRWTGPKFAVALRPPKEIPADGAKLYLEYTVPEVFIQKVSTATLSVIVNGKALEPETIAKAGSFKLERLVPAAMLQGDVATIDFAMDKYLEAGAVDQRELGLIVSGVGLQGVAKPAAPPAK